MKKIILIFASLIFILFFSSEVKANEIALIEGAKAGILMEQNSKKVLYEKDINKKLSPASMTKIMTLLLIYEAMENEQFTKNTILTTSEYASKMGGSQVYLKAGEKITVDEAIKCVSIVSANDCAVLLAEKVAGSEAAFVKLMNQRAKDLGCMDTLFSDCTGLTENNHYTTAYDLAIISRELLTKYNDILSYTGIREDYIRKNTDSPFWLVNTNKLIGKIEGVNGLKTGYTSFSGYCITLTMTKNKMTLISVVFGYDNANKRNVESLELLNYGFSNYKLDLIIKKNTVLEIKNHILYKNQIEIITKNDLYYLCKINEKNKYHYEYDFDLNANLGNINIKLGDNIIINDSIICKDKPIKKNLFEVIIGIMKNCFS